jgi:acyl-CoA synthetase (AMP-forming)/AMP-acid ligase II
MTSLACLLAGALNGLAHPVESVAGTPRDPSDLLALAEHAAASLRQHQVRASKVVHVRMGNRPADLASLLAVWQAGAVAVPVQVAAAGRTVARVQSITRARFLMDEGTLQICSDSVPPGRKLLHGAALVIFTSGSTADPKGVVIAHRRFAEKISVLARLLQFQRDDIVLVPLQLTFIFGLWVSLLALLAGAHLVLIPKFVPAAIRHGLDAGGTLLAGVPSMFRTLLADVSFRAPSLRMLVSGGEPMPKQVAQNMLRASPQAALYDLYGSTETGACDFCLGPQDHPQGLGTIGRPTEGVQFRIRPLANQGSTEGDAGELQIRTPFGMLGYLDQPELSAAAYADGYFRTGDLARLDENGHVVLVGRSKEIISRGGIKIAPLEIENLLCEHPDVAAALCAGVPDAQLGETVHALVVPRSGARIDENALRAWMLARTERFKVPDTFLFADALPVGPTGKLDRRAAAPLFASNQRK